MGTWDAGSFGNDAALDFLQSLDSAEQVAATIRQALPDDVDADQASAVIAACDLVAAMLGHPAPDMPADILPRLGAFGPPGDDLLAAARRAVERLRDGSELADLWAEAGDPDWGAAIADLLDRLDPAYVASAAPPVPQEPGPILSLCFLCETGAPEAEAVELVHEIDDGVIQSTMTLYAHRRCVEGAFEPPHWTVDGLPSADLLRQFCRFIEDGLKG